MTNRNSQGRIFSVLVPDLPAARDGEMPSPLSTPFSPPAKCQTATFGVPFERHGPIFYDEDCHGRDAAVWLARRSFLELQTILRKSTPISEDLIQGAMQVKTQRGRGPRIIRRRNERSKENIRPEMEQRCWLTDIAHGERRSSPSWHYG